MAQVGDIVKVGQWAETGILISVSGGQLVAVPHAITWEEFGRPVAETTGDSEVAANTFGPRPAEIVPDTVISPPTIGSSSQEPGPVGDETTVSPTE